MRFLFQDLRYALRQLRNTPVFALTTILTLALGIGINAAMFSVVDQVLLRAMPFPRAKEVVQMAATTESGGFCADLAAGYTGLEGAESFVPADCVLHGAGSDAGRDGDAEAGAADRVELEPVRVAGVAADDGQDICACRR
jgi:hypothetical protein